MEITDLPDQESSQLPPPPNAMTIVARERQDLHEKIARLRALREALEAEAAHAGTTDGVTAKDGGFGR